MQWDEHVITYWAARLEIDPALLTTPQNVVLFRSDKKYDERFIVYQRDTHSIVFAPTRVEAVMQEGLSDLLTANTLFSAALLAAYPQLGLHLKWRDYIYYWTQGQSYVTPADDIRVLNAADAGLLAELQAACTPQERDMGQITIDDPLVVGYFENDVLLGVASLLEKSSTVVDIGVLTHPQYRGLKIAKRLTRDLRDRALAQGKIVQYMCAEANTASMRVAESVGFELFVIEEGYVLPKELSDA